MRVNVVCRNLDDDRVIPRFARYLRDHATGAGIEWSLTRSPSPNADVVYLSGYFESQMCKVWPAVPVAAFFTHREEEPPGNGKAKLFDAIAKRVQLRVAMCRLYAEPLSRFGPTIQPPLPVERKRFVPPSPRPSPPGGRGRLVCGLSGYTYSNHRKGEDLVRAVLASKAASGVEWRASGRGWKAVPTRRYSWAQMPAFYQGLDVLVCTSRVEGGPMPPLEALACGVSVVVPRGVGILDELGLDVLGIHRYKRGDAQDLVRALGKALRARGEVDREALRAVTEPFTVQAWCRAHEEAFMELVEGVTAGIAEDADEGPVTPIEILDIGDWDEGRTTEDGAGMDVHSDDVEELIIVDGANSAITTSGPPESDSMRGIYCVAFGDPARTCALRMMTSAKKFMPEIPIALCASKRIGPEDVLIKEPDSDIGGRRAKLKAYELAPKEWTSVLYLDADIKVVGDIRFYFELIEDGWEFVICKDPHLMDTMHHFRRRNNLKELEETSAKLHTLHTLQYNGGVWAFGRGPRIARFFKRWQAEWERHAQRDQGALIRAMYAEPLRVYLLGSEWNTFEKYTKGIKTAGLMHYPGDARRWSGMIPGRIDSEAAWRAVERFGQTRRGARGRVR